MPPEGPSSPPTPGRRAFLRTLLVGSVTSLIAPLPGTGLATAQVLPTAVPGTDTTPSLRLRPADFEPLTRPFGAVRLGFTPVNQIGPMRPLLVVRDGETYRALSAECTHAGCLLPGFTANKIAACPCHGSRFNADGSVIPGSPAEFPLASYEVRLEPDGSLHIALPDFPPIALTLSPLTPARRLPLRFLAVRNVSYEVLTRSGPLNPWLPAPFALSELTPFDQLAVRGAGIPITLYLDTPGPGAWVSVAARIQTV